MIPFQVAEAIRRARRRHRVQPAGGLPLWRLVAGETTHLVRNGIGAPALAVLLSGAVVAAGVHVAIGPGYPGPVAPTAARWVLVTLVGVASVGLARTVPSRWGDVRHAVRRARVGLAVLGSAAAISVVKVGLHEVTPGPVMPAAARWIAVAVVVLALALAARRDGTPGV